MKFPFTIIIFLFACLNAVPVLSAASPSPSPLVSPSPKASVTNEIVTQNIKERLKETINEVSAQEQPGKLTGYVGIVKDIVQETIIVDDKSGKLNVLVSTDSVIVRTPGNATIKLENVKIEDGIIVMGTKTGDNGEIAGKRIIVSDKPFSPPGKTSGMGEVAKMTNTAMTVNAKDGSSIVLEINSKTAFKSPTGSLEYENIELGDTVIYSALVSTKDESALTASTIMQVKSIPSPSIKGSSLPSPRTSPRATPSI
jgi:hypothetical protein